MTEMTHKQHMLATLRGEPTHAIPYAPRLDLWYNANKLAGTLPAKYKRRQVSRCHRVHCSCT